MLYVHAHAHVVAVYHPTASLIFSAKKVIPSLQGQRLWNGRLSTHDGTATCCLRGLNGEGAPPERVEQPRPEALRPHSQPGRRFQRAARPLDGQRVELLDHSPRGVVSDLGEDGVVA
eukprot:scaffold108068_cov63-Phaeocystis_antarctica.AAC.1